MIKLIFNFLAATESNSNRLENKSSIKSTIEDTETSFCRKQIKIADATVDQNITLADTQNEYLIISADQQISIKLNGSVDSLVLKPTAAGVKSVLYFSKSNISQLLISNASGNVCNVDIISANI